jgi:serine phosphatase RsbU (regulator of sigma subunit)
LRLPAEIVEVSRRHARFLHEQGRWSLVDLGSRWGTRVNGVEIPPNCPVPIGDGDRIHVHPWAFRFSVGPGRASTEVSINDAGATSFHTLSDKSGEALREDMLNLLLEGSAALHAAKDERSLTATLVDIACRGSGLDAAVLRPTDVEGGIEVLAPESGRSKTGSQPMRFSRALLAAASKGAVAEYSPDAGGAASQTMIQGNVVAAICAPLLIGPTVFAYVYVQGANPAYRGAVGFCQALARLGGLAMANLQRIEIERRAARMRSELGIAALTQSVILPRAPITSGPFVCQGRSQPGDGYLGGDFFDFQILRDGRLAVTLGDVSGRGVQASILMAFAQGFLRAALAENGDLVGAASGLNRFVAGHSNSSQYITLWLGILDPANRSLSYIDAGHGLAHLVRPGNQWQPLNEFAGLVIGIDPDSHYVPATIPLSSGDRLLIISDGIVEQRRPDLATEDERQRFGVEGVRAALQDSDCNGLIDRLFDAVGQFAGSKELVDDATALLVHWQ